MRIFLLLSAYLLSSTVQAGPSVKSYDLNHDGIQDRFEYYSTHVLTMVKEDRNNDNKIDYISTESTEAIFKIVQYDNDFNQSFERKKSFTHLPLDQISILTELDSNGDGKFDVSYQSLIRESQLQENCDPALVEKQIQTLSQFSLDAVAKSEGGYIPTGFGYRVEDLCVKKWGVDIIESIKQSTQKGLQCLIDLDKKSNKDPKNVSGALRNSFLLSQELSTDKITFLCGDPSIKIPGAVAMASAGPMHGVPGHPQVKHPWIILDPQMKVTAEKKKADLKKVQSSLFHELLHTVGTIHGDGIEFSYACSTCCFEDDDRKAERETACKICLGNYSSDVDLNYLRDLSVYATDNYIQDYAFANTVRYLKEKNGDVDGLVLLAKNSANASNPIGLELASMIQKTHSLSPASAEILKSLKKNGPVTKPEFLKIKTTSKSVAEAIFELYAHKNGVAALDVLEKNKEIIKKELASIKQSSGPLYMVNYYISLNLSVFFNDMAVNGYPDDKSEKGTTKERALKLKAELGIADFQY